jgi:hypothetical protein
MARNLTTKPASAPENLRLERRGRAVGLRVGLRRRASAPHDGPGARSTDLSSNHWRKSICDPRPRARVSRIRTGSSGSLRPPMDCSPHPAPRAPRGDIAPAPCRPATTCRQVVTRPGHTCPPKNPCAPTIGGHRLRNQARDRPRRSLAVAIAAAPSRDRRDSRRGRPGIHEDHLQVGIGDRSAYSQDARYRHRHPPLDAARDGVASAAHESSAAHEHDGGAIVPTLLAAAPRPFSSSEAHASTARTTPQGAGPEQLFNDAGQPNRISVKLRIHKGTRPDGAMVAAGL